MKMIHNMEEIITEVMMDFMTEEMMYMGVQKNKINPIDQINNDQINNDRINNDQINRRLMFERMSIIYI